MALRCFIAIDIPAEIRAAVSAAISQFRTTGADVKWVAEENLHITLKFLGSTEEAAVGAIRDALEKKVSPAKPFYITIQRIGYFPPGRQPRVIWAGIDDAGGLGRLQRMVDEELAALGFPVEDRPFSPHLTIGRVRSGRGLSALLRKIGEFRETGFGEMRVGGIAIMKSDLRPAGPEYGSLARVELKGRTDVG